mmetsp:Transcript_10527/g.19403  ORF Transcript_10527/g.19403 Transcript_10527/m.19403 type:complete len:960 (+) Transcript_10527:2548-5427(+)
MLQHEGLKREYLLSCDLQRGVEVKVARALLAGDHHGGSDELYVSAKTFSGDYAMHQESLSTRSSVIGARGKASLKELIRLPVLYSSLQRDACLVFSVWSAQRGLIGVALCDLFDELGRLRQGSIQARIYEPQEQVPVLEYLRNLERERKSCYEPSERERIRKLVQKYPHDKLPRLGWLDSLVEEQIKHLHAGEDEMAESIIMNDEVIQPVGLLRLDLPLFRMPVLYEEKAYFFETSDGQGAQLSTRAWQSTGDFDSKSFPWSSELCVVHDPAMHNIAMARKESLNPVEAKYQMLNPTMVRGVVDRGLKPDKEEKETIQQVINEQSGRLERRHQDLLWKFSYSLTNDRKALIKFVMSVDWDKESEARQAEELLGLWATIDIADALRLLGGEPEFRSPTVRAHAVKILDQASDAELLLYLLQLVQALRYDKPPATTLSAEGQEGEAGQDQAAPKGDADGWAPGLLACFLIRRAVRSETLLSFFSCYLSTEIEHKQGGVLFGKVRNELLCQLRQTPEGRVLEGKLKEQTKFIQTIMSMGREGRGRAMTRQNYLQRMLKQADGRYHALCKLKVPVMHPLWPWRRVVGLDPDSVRVFNSKTQPIKLDLVLETGEAEARAGAEASTDAATLERSPAFFKVGDDVRQDQLVLHLLGVMDKMFKDVNLDLHLTLYRVLSFTSDEGVMEFVDGSVPLTEIHKRHGSISTYFRKMARSKYNADSSARKAAELSHQGEGPGSSRPGGRGGASTAGSSTGAPSSPVRVSNNAGGAASPMPSTPPPPGASAGKRRFPTEQEIYDDMVNRFIKSCAGYCMCTYILCVGDRHLDNILIRSDGALFHIDFGYIFGHDPRSWAVGPIRLTRDMIETMGGRGSPGFQKFISHCCQAYRVLRSNANLILNLLHLMKDSKIENLFDDHGAVIQVVRGRFELERTDESAEIWLLDKLSKCEDTFLTTFSDKLHNTSLYFA